MAFPQLMGVINVTPDSFSDGGQHQDAEEVLDHVNELILDGASIIDIGAESTRPGATPLSYEAEWARLEPVLADIIQQCHEQDVRVSLDSYHPENMKNTGLGGFQ